MGDQAQEDIQQLAANTCLPGKATTPERLAMLVTHVSRREPGLRAPHAPRHPVGGTECRDVHGPAEALRWRDVGSRLLSGLDPVFQGGHQRAQTLPGFRGELADHRAGVVEQRLERIEPLAEAPGVSCVVDREQALPQFGGCLLAYDVVRD